MKEFLNNISWIVMLIFTIFCGCNREESSMDYYSQAVKELKESNYYEAYKSFSKSIELDSTYGQAYFMCAQVLGLLNASKDSICEDLRTAEKLGYGDAKGVREKYCIELPKEQII